jgi:hypothetical protein
MKASDLGRLQTLNNSLKVPSQTNDSSGDPSSSFTEDQVSFFSIFKQQLANKKIISSKRQEMFKEILSFANSTSQATRQAVSLYTRIHMPDFPELLNQSKNVIFQLFEDPILDVSEKQTKSNPKLSY